MQEQRGSPEEMRDALLDMLGDISDGFEQYANDWEDEGDMFWGSWCNMRRYIEEITVAKKECSSTDESSIRRVIADELRRKLLPEQDENNALINCGIIIAINTIESSVTKEV